MITLDTLFRAVGAWLADTLAPRCCAACDTRLNRRAVLCASCARTVVTLEPGLLRRRPPDEVGPIVAFASFGGAIADAVRRFKYGARPDLAEPLGELLRHAVRDARLRADVVVPVPLHPARLAERGYNQAALLAIAAARELEAPLVARALARTRNTPQQTRLDRTRRLENMAGAFHTRLPDRIRGKHVVLVDDVATTGATLEACAAALHAAGAIRVTPLVIARAESGGDSA